MDENERKKMGKMQNNKIKPPPSLFCMNSKKGKLAP
jgi:hypothetical protein